MTTLFDRSTLALNTISSGHYKVHAGSHFFVTYAVADIGALTTPNDTITISFKTPNTTKWFHMTYLWGGPAGASFTLYETKTGGGASPSGTLQTYNNNRNISSVSTILDVAGANASKVSYDATVFTGGVTLFTEYHPSAIIGGTIETGRSDELVLKQNTEYQFAVVSTANSPAFISLQWYEHTNIP